MAHSTTKISFDRTYYTFITELQNCSRIGREERQFDVGRFHCVDSYPREVEYVCSKVEAPHRIPKGNNTAVIHADLLAAYFTGGVYTPLKPRGFRLFPKTKIFLSSPVIEQVESAVIRSFDYSPSVIIRKHVSHQGDSNINPTLVSLPMVLLVKAFSEIRPNFLQPLLTKYLLLHAVSS